MKCIYKRLIILALVYFLVISNPVKALADNDMGFPERDEITDLEKSEYSGSSEFTMNDILEAYEKTAREKEYNEFGESSYFTLHDLNNDCVPELIIDMDGLIVSDNDNYYYTFMDGKTVLLDSTDAQYPSYGCLYSSAERGTFCFYRGGPAYSDDEGRTVMPYEYDEYIIEGDRIKTGSIAHANYYEEVKTTEYYMDGAPCSAEMYRSFTEAFQEIVTFYSNTEKTRKRYIGNAYMCGQDTHWLIYGTTLTISGSGDIYDFTFDEGEEGYCDIPWFDYRNQIETIKIENGITSIGKDSFLYMNWLETVYIPRTVTNIKYGAFYRSSALKTIYYGGSEKKWARVMIGEFNDPLRWANIIFQDTGGMITKTLDFGKYKQNVKWGSDLFMDPAVPDAGSNDYKLNKNLAYMSLWLCGKANNIESANIRNALSELGFNRIRPKGYDEDYDANDSHNPGYCLASVEALIDGKPRLIVFFAGRGTQDFGELWTKDGGAVFNGFLDPGKIACDGLIDYIENECPMYSKDEIILWITGHSMGGGIAGQVARGVAFAGFPKDNTYVYTFAATQYDIQSEKAIDYPNVFTIMNTDDIVPRLCRGGHIGVRVEYSRSFGGIFDNHDVTSYYYCLSRLKPKYFLGDSDKKVKCDVIECPVNVSVYDMNDVLLCETRGTETYNYKDGSIFIATDGETKYIYSALDKNYRIVFTGTGAGTMDYTREIIDTSLWETEESQKFSNVPLGLGKTLINDYSRDDGHLNSALYIVNEDETVTKEITEDGQEVDIEAFCAPVASLASGTYKGAQVVSLKCLSPDAKIFYTTDGSDPSNKSQPYEGPIVVTESTIIKAVAMCDEHFPADSRVASYDYRIEEDDTGDMYTELSDTGIVVKQKRDISGEFSRKYPKYSVKEKGYASVSSKGIITAKKSGTITVAGYDKEGNKWIEKESVEIMVLDPSFENKTVVLRKKGEAYDSAGNISESMICPDKWISSNPKIISIDEKTGLAKVVSKGKAKITAVYGNAKYTFTINAVLPELSKGKQNMLTGATYRITMKNTMEKTVWCSSDTTVVSINEGVITAKREGNAKIMAYVNGAVSECVVSVKAPVISKKSLSLRVGKKSKVSLKNSKLKEIIWESSDPMVATVDEKGIIYAVAEEKAVIFTNSGGVRNECIVTVR